MSLNTTVHALSLSWAQNKTTSVAFHGNYKICHFFQTMVSVTKLAEAKTKCNKYQLNVAWTKMMNQD